MFCHKKPIGILVCLILCLSLSFSVFASNEAFDQWLLKLRSDALSAGISPTAVDAVIPSLSLQARVLDFDRKQPETTLSLDTYLKNLVSQKRIENGIKTWKQHRILLEQVVREFGVEAEYLIALWGIETGYGVGTGSFPVASCLATLAFDGRRGDYFRNELFDFMRLVEKGDAAGPDALGSWAGAMGQFQFMPSSYLKFATDLDQDGKRDLWNSTPDAVGSAANYLHNSGWRRGEGWGGKVKLPQKIALPADAGKKFRPASYWRKQGIKLKGVPDNLGLRLLLPEGKKGSAFLVTGNFDAILTWNRSNSFALAVGMLGDELRAKYNGASGKKGSL